MFRGHSDRRSPSVVYISEQMAFIYIFQKRIDQVFLRFTIWTMNDMKINLEMTQNR